MPIEILANIFFIIDLPMFEVRIKPRPCDAGSHQDCGERLKRQRPQSSAGCRTKSAPAGESDLRSSFHSRPDCQNWSHLSHSDGTELDGTSDGV